MWSQPSGSPGSHRSQTSVGSAQCRSVPQVVPPHSGPCATSTHEHPVSADAPFSNTSYGRQLSPPGPAPSQVGDAAPPSHGILQDRRDTHASTNPSNVSVVPVQVPF